MSYLKLQVSQGLAVIPSDTVRIPNPDTLVLSKETGDFTVANEVTVPAGGLLAMGIQQGAIIYNYSDQIAYYVLSVQSDTVMTTKGGSGGSAGALFNIYNSEANQPCILYVGGAGNVSAIMAQATNFQKLGNIIAGQIPLLFSAVPVGTFMPTQVIAVEDKGTTATNIVALW